MKAKTLILAPLFAFLFLTLPACTPEPELAFRSDLPGRWRISDYTVSGTEWLLNNDGTERERTVSATIANNDLEITFSDNPARYYSSGTYTLNLEYTEDGVSNTLSISETGIGQGSWTFDNGRLEMISYQGAEIYQFTGVTKNDDNTLGLDGAYELRRVQSDQPKTAKLEVSFRLSPL